MSYRDHDYRAEVLLLLFCCFLGVASLISSLFQERAPDLGAAIQQAQALNPSLP